MDSVFHFQNSEAGMILDSNHDFMEKLKIRDSKATMENRFDYIRSVYDTKNTKSEMLSKSCNAMLEKPMISYNSLIEMAITSSVEKELSLADILSWITENIPYYRTADEVWKHFIQYTLYVNRCFRKVPGEKWIFVEHEANAEYATWTRREATGKHEPHKRVLNFDDVGNDHKRIKIEMEDDLNESDLYDCEGYVEEVEHVESDLSYDCDGYVADDTSSDMELTSCETGKVEVTPFAITENAVDNRDLFVYNNNNCSMMNLNVTEPKTLDSFMGAPSSSIPADFSGLQFHKGFDTVNQDSDVFNFGKKRGARVKLNFSAESEKVTDPNLEFAYLNHEDSSGFLGQDAKAPTFEDSAVKESLLLQGNNESISLDNSNWNNPMDVAFLANQDISDLEEPEQERCHSEYSSDYNFELGSDIASLCDSDDFVLLASKSCDTAFMDDIPNMSFVDTDIESSEGTEVKTEVEMKKNENLVFETPPISTRAFPIFSSLKSSVNNDLFNMNSLLPLTFQ